MSIKKLRFYAAGLVAFLIGIPLTSQVFAANSWGGSVGSLVGDAIGESIRAS